jgi:hypothetical protein
MLCSHCQTPNPADYAFCSNCGEPVETETVIRPFIANKPKRNRLTYLLAATIAAVVLGLIISVAYLLGRIENSADRASAAMPTPAPIMTPVSSPTPTATPKAEPTPKVGTRPIVQQTQPINSAVANAVNAMKYPYPNSNANRVVGAVVRVPQACSIVDTSGHYPRAMCRNGHLSYSKVLTCAMNEGVLYFCPNSN